jgi:hypothetical protein
MQVVHYLGSYSISLSFGQSVSQSVHHDDKREDDTAGS